MTLLSVKNLTVSVDENVILKQLAFEVSAGEILGIVGESGSGKTMTLMAIADLLPGHAHHSGEVLLDGRLITDLDDAEMRRIRGRDIGIVFQDPMTALNPVQSIGDQVGEVARVHLDLTRRKARLMAMQVLARVGLPEATVPYRRYPHQLSGGQRQRVVIAMAIILKPKIILADEPTTALDVTTQASILELLKSLVQEAGCGLVLVTHDLTVVSQMADRVLIMKDGDIVERCETGLALGALKHPYSKALMAATTYRPKSAVPAVERAVLTVENLICDYRNKDYLFMGRQVLRAVNGVSFDLQSGETLALIGESGCGKSTLSRAILGLQPITSGTVKLNGQVFVGRSVSHTKKNMRQLRRQLQIVFQDPFGSFNPRHKVKHIIAEAFYLLDTDYSDVERKARVEDLLKSVQLPIRFAEKYPHQLSGGECQRVTLARALASAPDVIVLDEAVSALDVSVRVQILDLLAELSDKMNIAYIFVSHDLSLVEGFADRVLVMQSGRIVETGRVDDIFKRPKQAYTKSLLAALPEMLAPE